MSASGSCNKTCGLKEDALGAELCRAHAALKCSSLLQIEQVMVFPSWPVGFFPPAELAFAGGLMFSFGVAFATKEDFIVSFARHFHESMVPSLAFAFRLPHVRIRSLEESSGFANWFLHVPSPIAFGFGVVPPHFSPICAWVSPAKSGVL